MQSGTQNRSWKWRFMARAASISLGMCMAFSVPTLAEGNLEDAVIQYEELEELVRQGNADAVTDQNGYETSLAIYQEAYDTMVSGISDMNHRADELEEAGAEESVIAQYEQNAKVLSSSARQYRKAMESLNSVSSQRSRDQAVWTQVKAAQVLFGTCRQLEAQAVAAEKNAEASKAAFQKRQSEKAAGLCTELEALQAEKTAASAGISAQSMRDQADAARRKLAVFLGKGGTEIEVGEMPVITAGQLEALNLEEDREKAVIADSNVKSLRRSTASGDAERKLRSQKIDEARGSASVAMDSLFQELQALMLERDGAVAAWEAARKDYEALKIQRDSGAVSQGDFLAGEAVYAQKEAQKEAAEIALCEAYEEYHWAMQGA